MRAVTWISSPVGTLKLAEENGMITELRFEEWDGKTPKTETKLLSRAREELREYFAGKRREFTLPLAPKGTEFQRRVWEALLTIPYGETRSYGEIAALIGSPKASRAVGSANHRNPISIFIPCHRVIGADGSLTGYGGGLEVKRALLAIERKAILRTDDLSRFR
ncbi:MAG: methylated-DNA--[protein]-cysteine S-methyltransferase [Acutalibacter sp.]|nr:methylated-DNA--[protein]-cysteine S-methyltransferase [Acutalibacter sp.]